MSTVAAGTTIPLIDGKYRLSSLVGEGGMGRVYRAVEVDLDRPVAVKILRREWLASADMTRRFHTEAVAMGRLSHPNIVQLIECTETPEGLPCMVMEWVQGRELAELVEIERPLALERIASLVGQVLDALDEAHSADVTHGDVKSENVIVEARRGGREVVKLIDFGLSRIAAQAARALPAEGSGEHEVCGTPEYIAPELIAGGEPAPASDLYAVGVLLYELLTGQTPFEGGHPSEVLSRHVYDAPVPPSFRCADREVPAALDAVVLRALAKAPEDRFPDARAFRVALVEAMAEVQPAETRCASCAARLVARCFFCPSCGAPVAHDVTESRNAATRVVPDAPTLRSPSARSLGELRGAVGQAIASGDVDQITGAYVSLAVGLAGAGRTAEAIAELDEAIDVTTAGGGPTSVDPPPLWRLLLAQAQLYGLQQRGHLARTRAAQALHQAALASSVEGRNQARRLLTQLG